MPNNPKRKLKNIPIRRWSLLLSVLWTLMIGASLAWNLWQEGKAVMGQAVSEARAHFDKDMVYRRWNALHGGVYVPITGQTLPNPNLDHIPHRDITTPSGRRLTLMNPAYMTRQVQELGRLQYGVKGHITSLRAIRPGNEPDVWETKALQAFEEGADEIHTLEDMDGIPHIRFMRPLYTEEGCLKCHRRQGYQVGDVRGGISMSVPMDKYYALRNEQSLSLSIWYLFIYLSGMAIILFGNRLLESRVRENEKISRDLAHDRERIQSLLALSDLQSSTEKELIEFALEEVVRLTQSQVGYFHFYDEDTRIIHLFAWCRKVLDQCAVSESDSLYPLEKAGVWADCIRTRRPVVHNDYGNLPDKKGVPEGHFPITRHMSVPVMDGDRMVAVSGVGNKEAPYDDNDVTQLSLYMRRAWDIIKDKRSRTRIKEQETGLTLFRKLIDQAYDAIFIISPTDGRFLDVNERACEMLGYPREELLKRGVLDIDVGQPGDFSWERLVEALRRTPNMLLEGVHKRKDGSTFPVEINVRLFVLSDHDYMVAAARDISERKDAEKELKEHQANLEKIVRERTDSLEQKTGDLERSQKALQYLLEDVNEANELLETKLAEIEHMNRMFVDRELRMVELKERIGTLESELAAKRGD
jgi:PAS domain S-box-containing protein